MKVSRFFENKKGVVRLGCNSCGQIKLSSDFYVHFKNLFYNKPAHWQSRCKDCTKTYKTAYYQANADRINKKRLQEYHQNPEPFLERCRSRKLKNSPNPEKLIKRREIQKLDSRSRYIYDRYKHWIYQAKKRKLEWDLPFKIVISLIEAQKNLCFYTQEPLVFAPNHNFTLSIDRVDSDKGYRSDNIVFCGDIVNRMKLDLTIDEFQDIVGLLFKNKTTWKP